MNNLKNTLKIKKYNLKTIYNFKLFKIIYNLSIG